MTVRHTAASAGYDAVGQAFGATCAVLVDGGVWVQRGTFAATARTVGVSMAGASAVWDQQGAGEVDVPANGVAADSHTGISLGAGRTAWHQRTAMVVRVGVGVGVRAGAVGMAQWNQTDDLTVVVAATQSTGPVEGVALQVGPLGAGVVWLQYGRSQMQVTATGIGAIGAAVALDANNNRHRWEQSGGFEVTATAQNGGLVRGVRIGQQSTTWAQTGPVSLTGVGRANGTVHGIVFDSPVWSANLWQQTGPLTANITACADGSAAPTLPSTAIRGTSRCGAWRSTGTVDLTTSHLCAGGATGAHPMWFDSRGCNFTLDRAATIQGGAAHVRCDTALAAPSPVAVRGLPLGTLTQGLLPSPFSFFLLPPFLSSCLRRGRLAAIFPCLCSLCSYSFRRRRVHRPGAPARRRHCVGRRRPCRVA